MVDYQNSRNRKKIVTEGFYVYYKTKNGVDCIDQISSIYSS